MSKQLLVSDFRKVKLADCCGNYTYFLDEQEITEGNRLFCLFPDDTYDKFTIKGKLITNTINDMGHEYTEETIQLYIVIDYRGLKVEIPLERVKACFAIKE